MKALGTRLQALVVVSAFFLLLPVAYSLSTIKAQNCQSYLPNQSGVQNGLISTPSLSGKFGNTSTACVTNLPGAAIPSYNLTDQQYFSLKSRYYTQSKQPKSTTLPAGLAFGTDGLYNVTSLTVSATPTGSGTEVIFIDGDLHINSNITYHTTDGNGSLVLVVGGSIYIAPSITQIDAVLIGQGNIYTACSLSPCGAASSVQVSSPLVVNGNIISLDTLSNKIVFERNLFDTVNGNDVPAEQVNLQAKYLLLLKSLMSQTLVVQTEGTNYAGGLSAGAPSPTLIATPANVRLNATNQASFTLSWSGGRGATSCTASSSPINANFSGSISLNGSTTITVTSTGSYQYSLSCLNLQGIRGSATTKVIVSPNPNSISFSPNPISGGSSGTVSWTVTTPVAGGAVALYTLAAPDGAYISQLPTSCGSNSCSYVIPTYLPKGLYEVRYERADFSQALATSSPFTINN